MNSAKCRKHAQDCVEQAENATVPERRKLLKLAREWLALGDEADMVAKLDPMPPPANTETEKRQ